MNVIHLLQNILQHPLNRNAKLKAMRRFVNWQFASYFFPHPVVYPFIEDSILVVQKGMTGATGNIYNGLHEHAEMLFLLHFLREGERFVDVGANIGSYTILAAVNAKANVTAFEPVPKTFSYLKRNVATNHVIERVHLHNNAVGAEQKILTFTAGLDAANHVLANGSGKSGDVCEVECVRLDDVITTPPILIKVDVEGFETEVINGGMKTFSSPELKAIIIELNGSGTRYGYNEKQIHETLQSLGFKPYIYEPFTRQLTETTTWGTHNTIYLHDIRFVQSRVQEARKVKVNDQSI
jgi:FkbM family methyltransferase